MNESKIFENCEERESILIESQSIVNSRDILQDLEKDFQLIRYPKSHYDGLTQRCFTYVPGSETYPEV